MKVEDLKRGATEPCLVISDQSDLPKWLDMDKFKRGQKFFIDHLVVATVAMHCSLVVGFAVRNLLEALVFTQQSDTPGKAIKRYLDTFLNIYRWHTGDVWTNKDDPAYKSLRLVRRMHDKVARDLTEQKGNSKNIKSKDSTINNGNATKKKSKHVSEVYLNQYDMALVQVGFMGAITMYPSGFGLDLSKSDLEDYIHFWRGIGHILGVKDEFNICRGNYEETFDICKDIEEKVLMVGLREPAPDFSLMADAYCNGVNGFFGWPMYTKEAVVAFAMDSMGQDFRLGPLSWPDWIRVRMYKLFVTLVRWIPGFEHFFNRRAIKDFDIIVKKSPEQRANLLNALAARIDGIKPKND